ncbi:MAG: 5'-methylthioadenosine/adenosylhomocysteine nucleosidase, partial [Acutalibacteraceae bacterium]|nr:5'-methylthioadenosine/adenosylhomocysteine nucleosidase [Acutalibacteraceae bacterium]
MIGIICAMQVEADGIISLLENIEEIERYGMIYTRGKLNGKDVVVAVCGVGKVNAAICAVTMID